MLDAVLGLWIVVTLASTAYVAYDLIVRTPSRRVGVPGEGPMRRSPLWAPDDERSLAQPMPPTKS